MLAIVVFGISALLTLLIQNVARRHAIIDTPNERSSHTIATPRGGGLAIMIAFFGAMSYLLFTAQISPALYSALFATLPIVAVSLLDDIRPQSARIRLAVQLLCSLLALYALGGVTQMNLGIITLEGFWVNLIALLMLLWLSNLFNFLDGIDGYAASETLFVALAATLLFGTVPILYLAAAAAGFLLFNWHRASIFMGDVGSAPIGFIIGVFALNESGNEHFIGWIVLISLFFFDATVTLIRRLRHHETLWKPHKKHMYQRLHQAGFSHSDVVLLLMRYNVVVFLLLWLVDAHYYWVVLLTVSLLFTIILKIVDHKKAFE
ncbi:MAG: glycosyl transferase [Sulfurimonas sp.]|nr:MAG: glycosyl transferase [Sulfurimonas sp.]